MPAYLPEVSTHFSQGYILGAASESVEGKQNEHSKDRGGDQQLSGPTARFNILSLIFPNNAAWIRQVLNLSDQHVRCL